MKGESFFVAILLLLTKLSQNQIQCQKSDFFLSFIDLVPNGGCYTKKLYKTTKKRTHIQTSEGKTQQTIYALNQLINGSKFFIITFYCRENEKVSDYALQPSNKS